MALPRPREVWFIELEETRGHEQSGNRPVVVLARSFGMHVIIPFTTSHNAGNFPHTHMVEPDGGNGLRNVSFALCFQILSLDEERFLKKLGVLSESDFSCIQAILMDLFGFDDQFKGP
ncbi:MAG: type II toxin-antitoxin system PemK/MazF family toxin [Methanofollis sp.]|uniref:type II toxin-antitoxin system PemK/MazF family toxin n=1 Tax=Methanofollis sp. TaxID=2052835 RepID=UPI00260B646B|nr:type II toxin-antitoxin system PemK/MazF family toxin [Methanofollis sp.]MDD4255860.1 type II toxin-antitoxin system PemK/MazF family toxin [Methanofollis sp.]